MVADRQFREENQSRIAIDLGPALAAASSEVPGVPVRLRVEHAVPAQALLAAGERSQLLVVGRRHHLLPLGSHLGSVVRALLQHSTAPVLLNPESPLDVPVAVEDTAAAPRAVQPV